MNSKALLPLAVYAPILRFQQYLPRSSCHLNAFKMRYFAWQLMLLLVIKHLPIDRGNFEAELPLAIYELLLRFQEY
jgi:hypothetical protein